MDWQLVSRSLRAMGTGAAGSAPAVFRLDDEQEQVDDSKGESEAWRELEQLDLDEGEAQEFSAVIENEKEQKQEVMG
eukprot:2771144-Amphidinium_carterae.1